MALAVVDHVAALAQALEVLQPVVARVVIEIGGGEDDMGMPDLRRFGEVGSAGGRPQPFCQVPRAASNQRPSGRHRTIMEARLYGLLPT